METPPPTNEKTELEITPSTESEQSEKHCPRCGTPVDTERTPCPECGEGIPEFD